MNSKRFKTLVPLTIGIVLFSIANLSASDAVEWTILKTLRLEAAPIDVAASADGSRIFVLTDQGKVIVYSADAEEEDTFDIGTHVDKIRVSPRGDIIFANSRKDKTVQVFAVDVIQNINVSGSPFKGPADAPIVIAVFDDFQ